MSPPSAPELEGFERRVEPRRALRVNAELRHAEQRIGVRTLDISMSGIGISASINPRIGQTFLLILAEPSAPRGPVRIEMPVTVAHSILTAAEGEFKIGLRFEQLSRSSIEVVKTYLRS